jgi:hypothetical protein
MDKSRQTSPAGSQSQTEPRQPRVLTGLFRDRESAERAYGALTSRGYDSDDVNLIMSDETRRRHFDERRDDSGLGTKAAAGAGVGGAVGGAAGAIAAALTAVGTAVALPGLGIVIAGPIAAALAGAGAGGAAGSLIGALVGWGIPEDRVQEYERGVREGGIVLGVRPRSERDADDLRSEWERHRGEQIHW